MDKLKFMQSKDPSTAAWNKAWGLVLAGGITVTSVFLYSRSGETSSSPEQTQSSSSSIFGSAEENKTTIDKSFLADKLGTAIRGNTFPEAFELSKDGETKRVNVEYALNEKSQEKMQKLMGQYKPDYGAFVAMDAKTGRILSLVSYSAVNSQLENLTLRATFPAASIFKVVTASAAIDLKKAQPTTVVPFNGGMHTLYKKNVESTQVNRWTRHITLRDAFARSVNVFFGKLGLFYVGPENLLQYAERYLFNHPIPADVPVQMGFAKFSSQDPWSVVTAASGFTRDNTMSPLHGALIASAVANDGVMMEPFLVESLRSETGDTLYEATPKQASVVVDPHSADELRELFTQTVKSGTSRRSFRQIVRGTRYEDIEFGGKTGSLTGTDPVGKVDWFVGYARFGDQRIAVAALTVNEKKWRVKSSMLANLFFEHYIKESKNQGLAKNP